jgi:uncharacterized protein (DUF305 family)
MRSIKKFSILVLGVSAIIACDSQHHDAGATSPRSDVEFIDAMIPHHEMALEMTDMVLQKGSDVEVKAMAQAMKDAQATEIAEMKVIRTRLAGSAETTAHHDEHMMADMEKLAATSGAALDRLFLEEMLPHHAGAIKMAHEALPYLEETELQVMANKIVYDQAREIGDIAAMLEE